MFNICIALKANSRGERGKGNFSSPRLSRHEFTGAYLHSIVVKLGVHVSFMPTPVTMVSVILKMHPPNLFYD